MKTIIAAIVASIVLTTTATAGICTWVDRVDIAGSAKGSALLSGGWTLVTTGNPALAAVNGVATGAIVGGGLLAVDGTCYVMDEYNVVENTTDFVSDSYDTVTGWFSW